MLPLLALSTQVTPNYAEGVEDYFNTPAKVSREFGDEFYHQGPVSMERPIDHVYNPKVSIPLATNNVPTPLYRNFDSAGENKLNPLGKGIDASRCGPYAYNSEKVMYDVFDRDFLNGLYGAGYYDTSTCIPALFESTYKNSIDDMTTSYSYGSTVGAYAEGRYEFYKAKIAGEVSYSTRVSKIQKYTNVLFNAKTTSILFDYTLPEFAKYKSYYLNNLSATFLEKLEEATSEGTTDAYCNLFELFGTHVLWSASYGGACDVLYSARSKSVNLVQEVTTSIKASLEASAEVVEYGVKAGSNAHFEMDEKLNRSSYEIDEKMSARLYGGSPVGGRSILSKFEDLNTATDGWLNTINVNTCSILSYNNALPIWDVLPASYQSYKAAMKNAYNAYQEGRYQRYNDELNHIGGLADAIDEVKTFIPATGSEEAHHNGKVQKVTKTMTLGDFYNNPDIQDLLDCGFTKVEIMPVFFVELASSNKASGTIAKVKINFAHQEIKQEIECYKGAKNCGDIDEMTMEVELRSLLNDPGARVWTLEIDTNDRPSGLWFMTTRAITVSDFWVLLLYTKD